MAIHERPESDAEMLAWFEKRCQWYQTELVEAQRREAKAKHEYNELADAIAGSRRRDRSERDEWELSALVKSARDTRVELDNIYEAVVKVIDGFDAGIFVRDISNDGDSSWAVRLIQPLSGLASLRDFCVWAGKRSKTI